MSFTSLEEFKIYIVLDLDDILLLLDTSCTPISLVKFSSVVAPSIVDPPSKLFNPTTLTNRTLK